MLRRVGFDRITEQFLKQILSLPDNYKIGKAIDDGGCFFDAFAQTLNKNNFTQQYNENSLRKLCYEHYSKNEKIKDEVNQWMQDIDDTLKKDYANIQYDFKNLPSNMKSPIWGDPVIEGRLLCDALGLKGIGVIELIQTSDEQSYCANYLSITYKKGERQVPEEHFFKTYANCPIVLVSQRDKHFIPILKEQQIYCHSLLFKDTSGSIYNRITGNQKPEMNFFSILKK